MWKKSWQRLNTYFSNVMGVYPRPLWFRIPRWLLIHWRYSLVPTVTFTGIFVAVVTRLAFSTSPASSLPILIALYRFLRVFSVIIFIILIVLGYFLLGFLLVNVHKFPKIIASAHKDRENEHLAKMQRRAVEKQLLSGITLRRTMRGHKYSINTIAWSPDGKIFASGSNDWNIHIWDVDTGGILRVLEGHTNEVYGVTWSPESDLLASGSKYGNIRIWNRASEQLLDTYNQVALPEQYFGGVRWVAWSPDSRFLASGSSTILILSPGTGEVLQKLDRYRSGVYHLAWSPDSHLLASAFTDSTVRIWNPETGQPIQTLTHHTDSVYCVAWSSDGRLLASGSKDKTIRIWDTQTWHQTHILEEHTGAIHHIAFSAGNLLLASLSDDNTARLWHTDTWTTVGIIHQPKLPEEVYKTLAFHPKEPVLATFGPDETTIDIWDLNLLTLLSTTTTPSARYKNAKVILVGDSGVGKSGLSLALTNQPFTPTESTHARRVWNFDSQDIELDEERTETRETLLWDLAGQPGYRLIHQLYLNEVAVALVVFDARSETDPFAGVYHWDRALRLAQRIQGGSAQGMKKFLVAARVDRGGIGVSKARINALIGEMGFDGFFETSAKDGRNIADLKETIIEAIEWDTLPTVHSTHLFQRIKAFLITEKEAGRLLSTVDDLYRTFLRSDSTIEQTEDLFAQFETCIGRLESRDLVRQLSFGNLVLLQPEVLDIYASALVNAVKDEPDGLGSINEEKAKAGDFSLPEDERISNKEQERLLLLAMIEDLLRREIALREYADDGPHLIFPSQSTRENPTLPDPKGKAVMFEFEGPVLNIYATLAVRLSHSGLFKKKELWKNAVTYTTNVGGTYGIFLHNQGEGCAQLTLFFDEAAGEEIRYHFEQYIEAHLQQRALSESIKRQRIFTCSECGMVVTEQTVQLRAERGFNWLDCPVCATRIKLLDKEERLVAVPESLIQEMNRAADTQRDREATQTTLQGRREVGDFDVFLCYNPEDRAAVMEIGNNLKEHGLLPWLDEWELRPGLPWQRTLERQIGQIKTAAVFVGKNGLGPWQQTELDAFLREFVNRGCPVIPVLLADAPTQPTLPVFLKGMAWVDFRAQDPDPMERLKWGITGERRERVRQAM